jgi:hypothetical protein
VSPQGFEALRLSVWGAYRIFGDRASYAICSNNVPLESAKARTGPLPLACRWHDATRQLPASIRPYLDPRMAEGAAWKLAPLRMFPDAWEIALDNDCILWDLPAAVERWLAHDGQACLLAQDVAACFGRFSAECGEEPRNAGIRGMPPGFDLEQALVELLEAKRFVLTSELDEQGLQVAALSARSPYVVSLEDVTICSPFPPHMPGLGACGAHFCGLNARDLGWELDGRPASDYVRAHWDSQRARLYEAVGLDDIATALPPTATGSTATNADLPR